MQPDHAEQSLGDQIDDAVPSRGYRMAPVVGLGGSAGAIPALQAFFRGMPGDSGLAFVVVLHQSPEQGSGLVELIGRAAGMPVVRAEGGAKVQPNTVYVIPPAHVLRSMDGRLHLEAVTAEQSRNVTVDLFFRTLADTHGPHSAAVVLSGADGDGTIGIKRVKERGGLTLVQDPQEAEHESMPRSAIATGMVDWVLPVADMPQRLLQYFRLEKALRLPPEDDPGAAQARAPAGEDEAALRDVLTFLRARTGRDFTCYKRATILRRIARRMQVNGIVHLPDYLTCLRTRPGEAAALLQDLLISVTNFFRDAECFAALEGLVPELFAGKQHTDTVRVWVPACATGEEAYSIAMLLAEHARTLDAPPSIQVFATDLNDEAIQAARDGIYPSTIEADVSQERLRRFFVQEHGGWRVQRELRETVLFAVHDVLKDSPFSRLDLVSCRNLLIYLNREAQARVLETFHFALVPQGRLFLGSSESAEDGNPLFGVVDKKHRIFVQRSAPRATLPVPTSPGTLAMALALDAQDALRAPPIVPARSFEQAVPGLVRPHRPTGARTGTWGDLHLRLLEQLAPPSVLVDSEHDIVHLSPGAGRFLQVAGGEPTRNLLRMVHPDLRIELRAALYQAAHSHAPAEMPGLHVVIGGESMAITLRVVPAAEMGTELFLVLFQAAAEAAPPVAELPARRREPDALSRQLDSELERLKSHLRDTVEQYEASTEELKASNEELQAMNEELRSATEELETSREELQSINEELTTVNHELKIKLDELGHANSDMQNLMDATAIATVFLDRDLRITRYTPSSVGVFNLIPTDVGRPLTDLTTRLDYPQLVADARRVLERLVPVEREVGQSGGNWFLARLLPYRTAEDRIAGVVLCFVNITERKQAEEVRLWLSAVVNASTDAIISFALDTTILSWNGGAEQIFGHAAAEAIGRPLDLLAPERRSELQESVQRIARGESLQAETVLRRKDGGDIHIALSVSPIREVDGRVIGGTAIARDVSDARRAREALRVSEERLRLIVENARDFAIFSIDLDRRVTTWNQGAERLLGYSEAEMLGRSGDVVFTPEDRAAGRPEQEARTALQDGSASDDRMHVRKDGSQFWAGGMSMLMRDGAGQAIGFVKILRDQTAERQAREALERSQAELLSALEDAQRARKELEAADAAKDRFLAVLSHELRNPLASIASASELLMVPKLPAAALEKAALVVQRQSRAMKVLLDELLDVSRLALGRLTLSRRRVSVQSIVESALETTRPLVQAAGHELVLTLPPQEVQVDGDPLRLAQVVSNLVSNAAKYTPEGGRIVVSAEVFQEEVVITVSDNGIGMEPAEIDRMFDLFSQGDAALQRANGGLGIGLALARNIVELHGGWIMASSAGPGQGSQLRVGLPVLKVGDSVTPSLEAPAPQLPTAAPAAEGTLVLVADDNGDAAWGLAKLLELSGFRALTARSGEEALQLAEQHRPVVALLDIGMPDLSGHDVARRLRQQPWGRDMTLIAATGWGQDADVRHSMEAGFDAHLTKPLNVGRVKALIDELAARRRKG